MSRPFLRGVSHQGTRDQGFTLIEVLVSIAVMALMMAMVWRALDGMYRAQQRLQSQEQDLQVLDAALAQWRRDLDQALELQGVPAWDWDGKVLRMTRACGPTGVLVCVVAWTWRAGAGGPGGNGSTDGMGVGAWLRWQSQPLVLRRAWHDAWALALQWGRTPTPATQPGEVALLPMAAWRLFVSRGDGWSNPLSSAISAQASVAPQMPPVGVPVPTGVRLVLDLPPGQGQLTVDWLRPTFAGGMP